MELWTGFGGREVLFVVKEPSNEVPDKVVAKDQIKEDLDANLRKACSEIVVVQVDYWQRGLKIIQISLHYSVVEVVV